VRREATTLTREYLLVRLPPEQALRLSLRRIEVGKPDTQGGDG